MKKLIKIALCIGMAFPVAAFAQGAGGAAGGPGQIQMNEPLGHTYAAGIVRGSVVAMNLANGTILVLTGKNTVALSATPAQLSGLTPGDLVQFPYVNYHGALWLSPAVGGSRAFFADAYGQQGRVTGSVQAMARGTGEITVRGTAFRIHPAQLQGVLPGMFVDIIYVQIGNVNWITAIRPVAPSNGGAIGGGAGGLAGGGAGGAGVGGGAGARGAGAAHR